MQYQMHNPIHSMNTVNDSLRRDFDVILKKYRHNQERTIAYFMLTLEFDIRILNALAGTGFFKYPIGIYAPTISNIRSFDYTSVYIANPYKMKDHSSITDYLINVSIFICKAVRNKENGGGSKYYVKAYRKKKTYVECPINDRILEKESLIPPDVPYRVFRIG
jgi:hypothetical protein